MIYQKLLVIALLCSLCFSVSCNSCGSPKDLVTIHYRQSANMQSLENPTTCTSAISTSGMWVLYEITSIGNTDQQPLQFNFSLSKVYVLYSGVKYSPGFGVPALDNCLTTAKDAIVAPGGTFGYLGRFFINITPALSEGHANFNLLYDGPAGQGVLFVRDDGVRPTAPAFTGVSAAGLPMFFGSLVTNDLMPDILNCTSQLSPPSGCVSE
jgi:hypothetical protein